MGGSYYILILTVLTDNNLYSGKFGRLLLLTTFSYYAIIIHKYIQNKYIQEILLRETVFLSLYFILYFYFIILYFFYIIFKQVVTESL